MKKNFVLTVLILICFTSINVFAKDVKEVCKPTYTVPYGVYEGFQIVRCDKLYGIKNSFSHVMVNPKYSRIENIDNKFVKVKVDKNYGLLEYNGKVLIVPKYKDIAVVEFKLNNEKPFYLYLGKTKNNWFVVSEKEEIVINKSKEKVSMLKTELRTLDNKIKISDKIYYIQIGKVDLGEFFTGATVRILLPDNLPKWSLDKISTIGLTKIFTQKENYLK